MGMSSSLADKNPDHILHPALDAFMIGGLSLIFYLLYLLVGGPDSDNVSISWTMYYLSFFVNFPHFMASYKFLYFDYRNLIFKDFKFTWAAILAPFLLLIIIGTLLYRSYIMENAIAAGYLLNLMYFLVGHHYVKQTYGCMIIASSYKKIFYSKLESRLLLATMISIWFTSFLSSNSYESRELFYYGIKYTTLGFDPLFLKISYFVTAVFVFLFLSSLVRKYIRTGELMPFNAVLAFISIFVWYLPFLYQPQFFITVAFFHSLQYLLFATAFEKNKSIALSKTFEKPEQQRLNFLKIFGFYFLFIFMTGFLAWDFVPKTLDQSIEVPEYFGTTIFMFSFHIFLNIHHYIIDNVIWRKDNQQIRAYLG